MSAAFDNLMKQPEPRPLLVLHAAKVIAFLMALVSLLVGAVTYALGFVAASVVIALLANRWSESLFARRATKVRLDEAEARKFWRTYDWDEADA